MGASKVGQVEAEEESHRGKELCAGTATELHCPLDRGREFKPPVSAPVSLSFSREASAFPVTGLSGREPEGTLPRLSVFPDPIFAFIP